MFWKSINRSVFIDNVEKMADNANADETFRREIRTVPTNGRKVIVLPDAKSDLAISQMAVDGEYIDTISKNGIEIVARTPAESLFFLQEPTINVGEGYTNIYDKSAAFGCDERLSAKEGKLPLTPLTLDAMIEAFSVRAIDLETRAEKRDFINSFYPYATYRVFEKDLMGRLLVSRAIAPEIASEIKTADDYFDSKGHGVRKCLYCDMAETEVKAMQAGQEHRVILANDFFVSMQPYASPDPHTINIYTMKQHHTARFTKLTVEQKKILAEMMYDGVMRILTRRPNRYFSLVHMSIHSAPLQHNGSNDTRTRNKLDDLFGFHVEISPGIIPPYGSPFEIPHSEWRVVPGRPRDTAKSLRDASYDHP
ncbi:hypothetical protein HYV80_02595 [Candidatus Woesearchaeota archaeon]|nr:hypothetical protein [Candidatus Woesearchaeota archaeon]